MHINTFCPCYSIKLFKSCFEVIPRSSVILLRQNHFLVLRHTVSVLLNQFCERFAELLDDVVSVHLVDGGLYVFVVFDEVAEIILGVGKDYVLFD